MKTIKWLLALLLTTATLSFAASAAFADTEYTLNDGEEVDIFDLKIEDIPNPLDWMKDR